MGSIMNPSPGDLVDRQTILQLKIEHCGTEGDTGLQPVSAQLMEQSIEKSISRTVLLDKTKVNIHPFLVEHEAIQVRLEMEWFPKLASKFENQFEDLSQKLRAINKELWKLEDQARIMLQAPDPDSMLVLKRCKEILKGITYNNDSRARLVKEINALWGIQVEEKMYA